jgi:THO complex subunit 6
MLQCQLCAGGQRLSLWHLRSLDDKAAFQLDDSGIHVAMFHGDRIMAVGASPYFCNLKYTAQIASSTSIYSAVYQDTPLDAVNKNGASICSTCQPLITYEFSTVSEIYCFLYL